MGSSESVNSCVVENRHGESFSVLTEEERRLLDDNTINIAYKKGEVIAKQGSFASHVIFLEKGLVKVFIGGIAKDLILKIIPSDHFIGLSSIYEGNNAFIYSASTYIDSEVMLIDLKVFKQLLHSNPQFAYKIFNIQNENAAQVYGRFYCLTRKQSAGLVADLLLCLSNRVFKNNNFCLPISRNDFADLTGLSVESVMRIMKNLKQIN
ncbi:MAG: Crp/Fnr family transcriptional regulator [Bacteroidales bacterium]